MVQIGLVAIVTRIVGCHLSVMGTEEPSSFHERGRNHTVYVAPQPSYTAAAFLPAQQLPNSPVQEAEELHRPDSSCATALQSKH